MLGILSKEEAEMLIGAGLPKDLTLPNGKNNMVSEEDIDDQGRTESDN